MKDLAPSITRQRLLIEATYNREITEPDVRECLTGLAYALGLRTYGEPIIHSPSGQGSPENQGFDAFVPLIDSGISLYIWTNKKFMSSVLYTCKSFDSLKAVEFIQSFFNATEIEYQEF